MFKQPNVINAFHRDPIRTWRVLNEPVQTQPCNRSCTERFDDDRPVYFAILNFDSVRIDLHNNFVLAVLEFNNFAIDPLFPLHRAVDMVSQTFAHMAVDRHRATRT